MANLASNAAPTSLGKYRIFKEIAAGGMATVHVGRLRGPAGFLRNVAIKRLHPQYAKDAEFVTMFMHEAQLSARISHPNVLPTLDVVAGGDELYLVMDYVHGDSLARLLRAGPLEPAIASGIMVQVLLGLHAAHEARDDDGTPLAIVHRDVSPHNILVDEHGVARIVDFGIAKAVSSVGSTDAGKVKGKLAYLSPEQLEGAPQDRRVDVFATGIVLYESLTAQRLFGGGEAATVVARLMQWDAPASAFAQVPEPFRDVLRRALARRPEDRFANAREMAVAIQAAVAPASGMAIAEWLQARAGETLAERKAIISAMERTSVVDDGDDARIVPALSEADRTNIATVTRIPREESHSTRWLGVAALGLLLLGLGALALHHNDAAPPTQPLASNGTAVDVAPPTTATATVAPVTSPREANPSTNDIPVVDPDQLPSEARPAAVTRAPQPAPRRAKVDCKVPFTIDAAGMKHFKTECFR